MADNVMRLRVSNPTGLLQTNALHAVRLDTLDGVTIGEMSNGSWQYDRIFPYLREQLKARYPTARILPYTEVVEQRADLENLDHVARVLKAKGCRAVIVGMAA